MIEGRQVPKFRWLRWQGVVLVLVAAASWPLHVMAVNLVGIVRPERVVGLIVLVWALGVLLIRVLVTFGLEVEPAEVTAFTFVALAMNGGPILDEFDQFAYLILIACPILAGWLALRLHGRLIVPALVWGMAVAFASGSLLTFIGTWQSQGDPSVVDESPPLTVDLATTPDVFLVVFDGYPGALAAEQDRLETGVVDVMSELRSRRFQVPESSWSAYWATSLSIPSLLDMNYPISRSPWKSVSTTGDLHDVIGGASVTVETLKANGYATHMVETGWSGSSCGSGFDRCVPSPLIDEATYLILRHTVAWEFLDESPGPYVIGALSGFEWLLDEAPALSESISPDFVFMHVVSPHPPLLLDSECTAELAPGRAGTNFNVPGVDSETRAGYLVNQIDCMDRMMIELADAVEDDDIVIFVSDHGTDRRDQANPDLVDWDRQTIVERLNNFLAVRLPEECTVGDEVIVPNVLRLVLGCMAGSPIDELPERMWVNPMVELDPEFVDELLGMRASPESLEN